MSYLNNTLLGGAGPAAPKSKSLRWAFWVGRQEMRNWCWAAVTSAVAQYYKTHFRPALDWRQCKVANAVLKRKDCCGENSPSQANITFRLVPPLQAVGHYAPPSLTKAAPFKRVTTEIDAGRPVCVRVAWDKAGLNGHFVAIDGYDRAKNNWVRVQDPLYGPTTMQYDKFRKKYRTTGRWTHTYFTQPKGGSKP